MRALERFLLLEIIDQRWREHLYDMDYLREGIHLRGFAQIEPLVAYKNEAFELFRDLMNSIWGDFARMIFHVEVTRRARTAAAPPPDPQPAEPALELLDRRRQRHLLGRRRAQPSAVAMAAAPAPAAAEGYGRGGAAAGRRAAPRRREPAARAQRPVLVRVGQEVQEVPRRLSGRGAAL